MIIGNGNVAIDVARIFSRKIDDLKSTDINDKVLELRNFANIENVLYNISISCHKIQIVARRGAIQGAFTTKSLRELMNLEGVEKYIVKEEIGDSLNETSLLEQDPTKNLVMF